MHFEKLSRLKSGDPTLEETVDWPYLKSLLFLKFTSGKRPSSGNLTLDAEDIPENEDDYTAVDDTEDFKSSSSPGASSVNSVNSGPSPPSVSAVPSSAVVVKTKIWGKITFKLHNWKWLTENRKRKT